MWLIAATTAPPAIPAWALALLAIGWAVLGFLVAFEPSPVEWGAILVGFAVFNIVVLILAGGSLGMPDRPNGTAADFIGSTLLSMAQNGFDSLFGEGALGIVPIVGGVAGFAFGLHRKAQVESG
jgi:hypothetical protein